MKSTLSMAALSILCACAKYARAASLYKAAYTFSMLHCVRVRCCIAILQYVAVTLKDQFNQITKILALFTNPRADGKSR